MTAGRARVISRGNRTRLSDYCDHYRRASARRWRFGDRRRYCAANTNGTLTVVVPLDAGNCQLRTFDPMQPASPR